MITFKQFLVEEESFDIEKFKTDCAFMLEQLKGKPAHRILWHGSKDITTKNFEIRTWRERTKPRDSIQTYHDALNKFFTEKFGSPVRNWLFTTGNYDDAHNYAGNSSLQPVAIFPIGKFEWVNGVDKDLRDMTGWHTRVSTEVMTSDPKGKISDDEVNQLATNFIVKKLMHMKWRHNTNLSAAIWSKNEIMIKCDKFYAFNPHGPAFKKVKRLLGNAEPWDKDED